MNFEDATSFLRQNIEVPISFIHAILTDALRWQSVADSATNDPDCRAEAVAFLQERFGNLLPAEALKSLDKQNFANLAFYHLYTSREKLANLAKYAAEITAQATGQSEPKDNAKDMMIPEVIHGVGAPPLAPPSDKPEEETEAPSDTKEALSLASNMLFAQRQLRKIESALAAEQNAPHDHRDIDSILRLQEQRNFYEESLSAMGAVAQALKTIQEQNI